MVKEKCKKTNNRYGDFNAGYLYDKAHSPPLSPGPEDACNSTFDVDDSQHQMLGCINISKDHSNQSELHSCEQECGNHFQRTQTSHSVGSREASSRLSSINTKGNTGNLLPGVPTNHPLILNNNSAFLNQPTTELRTGRGYKHYLDAHAFSKCLMKSQTSNKNTVGEDFIWPRRVESLGPAQLKPEKTLVNSQMNIGSNNIHSNKLPETSQFKDQIDLERVDRIGNREKILESNNKFGKPQRRWALPSGIPVRAT